MIDEPFKYPKCGSKEVIEAGTSQTMCQKCYHVFDNQTYLDKSRRQQRRELCPICGKPATPSATHKCPYCMREGICIEHFHEGICSDCKDKYVIAVDDSEKTRNEMMRKSDADYQMLQDIRYVKWYPTIKAWNFIERIIPIGDHPILRVILVGTAIITFYGTFVGIGLLIRFIINHVKL